MPDMNPYRAPAAATDIEGRGSAASDLARALDRRGIPLEAIASRLARRGFDPAVIGEAISQLPPRSQRALAPSAWRRWLGGRGPFELLAFGFLSAGGVVALGNVTGMAPTIPYLGSVLFLLGAYLWRASQS